MNLLGLQLWSKVNQNRGTHRIREGRLHTSPGDIFIKILLSYKKNAHIFNCCLYFVGNCKYSLIKCVYSKGLLWSSFLLILFQINIRTFTKTEYLSTMLSTFPTKYFYSEMVLFRGILLENLELRKKITMEKMTEKKWSLLSIQNLSSCVLIELFC